MELNKFEKIIATRNLRESMDKVALGIFDRQHLEAVHQQMCQNLDHRPDLGAGRARLPVVAMDSLARSLGDSANAVVGAKHKEEAAQELAKAFVTTLSESPFASFNKQVAMLMVDGMAKSSGNVIDWKKLDADTLEHAVNGSRAVQDVSNLFESAMLPKAKMELTPLERKEVHYRRQKPASNEPSLTAQTYLLG